MTQTPDEARAAMAASINAQFNRAIDEGRISGADKIPMLGDATPPPPAPTADVAAPVTPAPAPTVVADTPPVEPGKKIFDKYADLEQAGKGYWNAVNTLSSTLDEKSKLEAEVQELRRRVAAPVPEVRSRVNPVERNVDWAKSEAVTKASEATGIPAEVFADFAREIHSQSIQGADQALADRLAPMQAVNEAETYMRTNYPESLNHTKEIENFIKATPTVAQAMRAMIDGGTPSAALEYAWKMYGVETGIGLVNKMKANAAVAEEAKIAARADAGLSSTPSTPVQVAAGPKTPSAEQIAWLKDRAKNGDERAQVELRRFYVGNQLPAHMRTWEQ